MVDKRRRSLKILNIKIFAMIEINFPSFGDKVLEALDVKTKEMQNSFLSSCDGCNIRTH